ncbi:MAG: hypothetical protein M3396_04210 [Actinomycetota bacterium]|nr:hypothetical protein [Actinomycetota bacterium]
MAESHHTVGPGGAAEAPEGAHEWVSFEDPEEERTWVFDVTFLTSPWTCIFGRGCLGVLTAPAPELVLGCCSYGAHFTDEEDLAHVEAVAATLTDEEWQFRKQGRQRGISKTTRAGETVTRLVGDACIFLNRDGFEGGVGCALHVAALKRGQRPLDLKPSVCWQVPLRREDSEDGDGHVTSTIRQWDRKDWGPGGFEFHWWCTQSPEAFVGSRAVYQEMADELIELVGEPVYAMLVAYLSARTSQGVPLPHPEVRRRD